MSTSFTGKSIPKGVSLPEDMWAYLEQRRTSIGIPVSRQVQDAIENEIYRRCHELIDTPGDYVTATIGE